MRQSLQKNHAFILQGVLFLYKNAVFEPRIGILAEKRGISSVRISTSANCRAHPPYCRARAPSTYCRAHPPFCKGVFFCRQLVRLRTKQQNLRQYHYITLGGSPLNHCNLKHFQKRSVKRLCKFCVSGIIGMHTVTKVLAGVVVFWGVVVDPALEVHVQDRDVIHFASVDDSLT